MTWSLWLIVQIKHRPVGASECAYYVPRVVQMKAAVRTGYTSPSSAASVFALLRFRCVKYNSQGPKRLVPQCVPHPDMADHCNDLMYAARSLISERARGVAGIGCRGVLMTALSLSVVALGLPAIELKLGTSLPCIVLASLPVIA